MDREKAESAFTIIELLMVISIIGILTSILMPSLMGAREKVKGAVCQKNLSQIMLGASQYSDDWNGSLPIYTTTYGDNWFSSNSGDGVESGKVGTYLDDNLMIYYCPANPNRHYSGNGDSATPLNSTKRDNLSYGINRDSTAQAAISLQEVARTSEKLFFADSGTVKYSERSSKTRTVSMKQAYNAQGIFNRHEESKGNVVFIDGHVGVFQNVYLDVPSSINYTGETMADKHWRLRQE